jgi:hypothetical protein
VSGEELLSLIFEEIQGRERVHERQSGAPRGSAAAKKSKLP